MLKASVLGPQFAGLRLVFGCHQIRNSRGADETRGHLWPQALRLASSPTVYSGHSPMATIIPLSLERAPLQRFGLIGKAVPSAWLIRKSRIVPRFTLRSALAGLLLCLAYSVSVSASGSAAAAAPAVDVIRVDGVINSVSANYVSAAVARAGSERAGGLVVVLNTP